MLPKQIHGCDNMIDKILDVIYQHFAKTEGESELLYHFVQESRFKVQEIISLLGDTWEEEFKK